MKQKARTGKTAGPKKHLRKNRGEKRSASKSRRQQQVKQAAKERYVNTGERTKFAMLLFNLNLRLSQVQEESKLSYKLLHDMKAGTRDNFNDSTWQAVVDAIIRLRPSQTLTTLKVDDIKGY